MKRFSCMSSIRTGSCFHKNVAQGKPRMLVSLGSHKVAVANFRHQLRVVDSDSLGPVSLQNILQLVRAVSEQTPVSTNV